MSARMQDPHQVERSKSPIARIAGWAGAFVALVLVGSGGAGAVTDSMGAWAGAIALPGPAPAIAGSAHDAPAASASPPADAPERPDAGSDGDAAGGRATDGRVFLNV